MLHGENRRVSIKFRVLLAIVVTAAVSLSACDKSEESAPEPKAPQTGAFEEGKAMVEQPAEVTKEGAEKASETTSAPATGTGHRLASV